MSKARSIHPDGGKLIIPLLFLLSGMAGLIYQMVWTRMLVLIFGNTLFATATVLSSFMAGLAAGSYFLGRYIDRRPRPLLKLYAWLELGIGLFALVFPILLGLAGPLYQFLYQGVSQNLFLLNSVRFLVCFILILVPTFLMGATLPVLVKHLSDSSRTLGNRMGLLYAINTAGAVLGVVISGFYLLKTFGMQATSLVAVALNLLVATIAWRLGRRSGSPAEPSVQEIASPSVEPEGETYSKPTVVMALVAIGISGFCSLAYEVFWNRMLSLFYRNTVYSFTTILATFLTGIALGSFLYYRFLSRYKRRLLLLAVLEIGIGLAGYITPYIFTTFYQVLFADTGPAMIFLKSGAIMLIPTVLMGMTLPLATEICKAGPDREGHSVGRVYAINTVGSILGPFFAGFILIPFLGIHLSVILLAGLNGLAGLLVLLSRLSLKLRLALPVILAGLVFLLLRLAPADLFYRLYQTSQPHTKILTYTEGTVANVVVYDFWKEGFKDLYLNGVEEASSRLWHVQLFKVLGILPPLLHPDPDDGLMVAFGAGMSAGAAAGLVDQLDCVELNPDVRAVGEVFSQENLNVLNNPKFNLIVNDGRNQLYLSPRKYSVIISDATHPMSFDSWTLYSQEFYRLVKSRLKPRGIFCQWIPMPLAGDGLKVILNTFRSVFPHTSFWVIHGSSQCLMLATPERLAIDYQTLDGRLKAALEFSGLAGFGIPDTQKLLTFFFLGEEKLASYLDDFDKISTDDLPHPQFYGRMDDQGIQTSLDLLPHQETIVPHLVNPGPDRDRLLRKLGNYLPIARAMNLGFLRTNTQEFERALLLAKDSGFEDDQTIRSLLKFDQVRKDYFIKRTKSFPDDHNAHNTLGYIHLREADYPRAVEEFERALELKPDFANALVNLAQACTDSGRYDLAVEKWRQLRTLNPTGLNIQKVKQQLEVIRLLRKISHQPNEAGLQSELARLHLGHKQPIKAIGAFRRALELAPDDARSLAALGELYQEMEMNRPALQAYRRAAGLLPDDREIKRRLQRLERFVTAGRQKPRPPIEPEPTQPKESDELFKTALRRWNQHEFDGAIKSLDLEATVRMFEAVIRKDPTYMQAYVEAATVYESLGRFKLAAEVTRRGLKQAPGNQIAEAHHRRLELLARLEQQPGSAELANIFKELGHLCWKTGDFENASLYLLKALKLDPRNPMLHLNLGSSYWRTGQYRRALDYLKNAYTIKPDIEGLVERIEKIENILAGGKSEPAQ